MKGICYFSYCWDNPSEIMEYLKEEIEIKSNGKKGKMVLNAAYKPQMTNLVSTIINKTLSAKRRKNFDFKSQEDKSEK